MILIRVCAIREIYNIKNTFSVFNILFDFESVAYVASIHNHCFPTIAVFIVYNYGIRIADIYYRYIVLHNKNDLVLRYSFKTSLA